MADEPITEPVDEPAEPVDEPVDEPQDEPKFNKVQLQQISSIMGNLIKKSIDEQVLPMVNQRKEPDPIDSTPDNPAYQKFNEKVSEKLFGGDIVGAVGDILRVHEKANQNLTKNQQTELNKAMSGYQDKEYYKDIHPEMDKMAKDLVTQGYPPGPAAELAYQKSLNSHLMGTAKGSDGSLSMISGGRRTVNKPDGKLPPQFEKAYQQGKSKGLWKDRKEYAASLDERVADAYGIKV